MREVLTSSGSQEVMYLDGRDVASESVQAAPLPVPYVYLGAGFLGGAA